LSITTKEEGNNLLMIIEVMSPIFMVALKRPGIDHIGVLYAVQQHVHVADPQHGIVEVKPVKQAVMEMLPEFGVGQHLGVVMTE